MTITERITQCHTLAKDKGFWDAPRDMGEAIALINSELYEALEAHRKGDFADARSFDIFSAGGDFTTAFKEFVKDSVEDELADAAIRLYDLAGGFNLDAKVIEHYYGLMIKSEPYLPANFGGAILAINRVACKIDTAEQKASYVGDVLGLIDVLCSRLAVDLQQHIDLKLKFNATRARLHGKAY